MNFEAKEYLPKESFKVLSLVPNEEHILCDLETSERSLSSRLNTPNEVNPVNNKQSNDPVMEVECSLLTNPANVKTEILEITFEEELLPKEEPPEWNEIERDLGRISNSEDGDNNLELRLYSSNQRSLEVCQSEEVGPHSQSVKEQYSEIDPKLNTDRALKRRGGEELSDTSMQCRHLRNSKLIPIESCGEIAHSESIKNNFNTSSVISYNRDLLRKMLHSTPSSNKEQDKAFRTVSSINDNFEQNDSGGVSQSQAFSRISSSVLSNSIRSGKTSLEVIETNESSEVGVINKNIDNFNASLVIPSNNELLKKMLQSAPFCKQEQQKSIRANSTEGEVICLTESSVDDNFEPNDSDGVSQRQSFSRITSSILSNSITTKEKTSSEVIEISESSEEEIVDERGHISASCNNIFPRMNNRFARNSINNFNECNVSLPFDNKTQDYNMSKNSLNVITKHVSSVSKTKNPFPQVFNLTANSPCGPTNKINTLLKRREKGTSLLLSNQKSTQSKLMKNIHSSSEVEKQNEKINSPIVIENTQMEKANSQENPDTILNVPLTFLQMLETYAIGFNNNFRPASNFSTEIIPHSSYNSSSEFLHHRLNFNVLSPKTIQKKSTCNMCNKSFDREVHLRRHIAQVHSTVKKYVCLLCCKAYNNENGLAYHNLTHHSSSSNKYKCKWCRKFYPDETALNNHYERAHLEMKNNIPSPETCDICQKVFSNRKNMQNHKIRKHNTRNKIFICNDCSASFTSKTKLSDHIKVNHMPPEFDCSLCSQYFPTKVILISHLRKEHGIENRKTFVCETCGKTVKNKTGLENHVATHSGKKPYVCEECGKSFRTESNLKQHSVTHSDVRRFSCDLCGKSFRIRHHLHQHMATHGMASTPKYGKRARSKKMTHYEESSSDESSN